MFKFKSQDSVQQFSTRQESNEVSTPNISQFFRLCSCGCCYNNDSISNVNFDENIQQNIVESCTNSTEIFPCKYSPKLSLLQKQEQQKHERDKKKFIFQRLQNILHYKNTDNLQESCTNNNKKNNQNNENKNIQNFDNLSFKEKTDSTRIENLMQLGLSNSKNSQQNKQCKNSDSKEETNFIVKRHKRDSGPMLRYQNRIRSEEELELTIDDTFNEISTISNQSFIIENNEKNNLLPKSVIENSLQIKNIKESNLLSKKISHSKPTQVEIELECVEPNLLTKFNQEDKTN